MIPIERKRAQRRASYHANKHKRGIKDRVYKTPEERVAGVRAWREGNRDKILLHRQTAKAKMTPEKRRAAWLKSMAKPEVFSKATASQKRWHKENLEKTRAAARKCYHKRKQNPKWAIAFRLRSRLYSALARSRKSASLEMLTGCTFSQLRFWIESHFKPGMNWKNKAEWELDHIVPIKAFDLETESEQRKCFHYTNLSPLWISENRSKQAKVLPFTPVQFETFLGLKTA